MKIIRQKGAQAIIPTASMADIAFLLIIFFMVTTVYDVDKTSVQLPTSVNWVENEKGAAVVVLHEEIDDATGAVDYVYLFSDGEKVSHIVPGPKEIYFEATRIMSIDEAKQFIVKADGSVRYQLIDELLDNLRQARVTNTLLLTNPAAKEG